jgi:chemotaxis protein methyltransferase CheR
VKETTDIEIEVLLEAIYQKYGYDFRDYSKAHIKRRILLRLKSARLSSISQMQEKVLNDKAFAARLLQDLSITVTEMFRNPDVYSAIREKIIPALKTYPFIKIWHAGCATGEEVYSMAIMLEEEGALKYTTIYATDFNQNAINAAKEGIYSKDYIRDYAQNYKKAGGKKDFSDYYTDNDAFVMMNRNLKKNVVWANHNLVTDSVFSTVHFIICRNVLIYFTKELQDRVQKLFYESLVEGGFLCLGSKESLLFTEVKENYEEIDKKNKLYKKKY